MKTKWEGRFFSVNELFRFLKSNDLKNFKGKTLKLPDAPNTF